MRKRIHLVGIILAVLLCFLYAHSTLACSTVFLRHGGKIVFGKNYDWGMGSGLVFINKRSVKKAALMEPPEKAALWVSKYGSITFNQVSKEFPFGGINEAGLVIEQMWLEDSLYPEPDEHRAMTELQWIQYQLDNHASVAEVIQSDKKIRIAQNKSKIHFLVGDRSGNVAVVEFLNGKCEVKTGAALPLSILTNSTYADSMAYLKKHVGFGGQEPISDSIKSLDRFVRLADRLRNYDPNRSKSMVDDGFDLLSHVAVDTDDSKTYWTIVYDIQNLRVHFKTYKSPGVKTLDVKDFDFSCEPPVKVLDINTEPAAGLPDRFTDYSAEVNRKLVQTFFAGSKGRLAEGEALSTGLEMLIKYPASTRCIRKKK